MKPSLYLELHSSHLVQITKIQMRNDMIFLCIVYYFLKGSTMLLTGVER